MTDDELSEVYLVVRPEERYAVDLALEALLPPLQSSFNAVGRGRGGGLRAERPTSWWPFGRPPAGEFLPKVVFYLVVPSQLVEEILGAVTVALRAERGDVEHGLGTAFVLPIESEVAIHGARPVALVREAAQ